LPFLVCNRSISIPPHILSESQGIVAIGLAFGVLELPRLGGGVGDETGAAALTAKIVNPAGEGTRLDDDGRVGICSWRSASRRSRLVSKARKRAEASAGS
jgi:hypothetical protein